MEESFIQYIEQSIKNNWDKPSLTDFKGVTSSYKDVARKIEKLHILFEHSNIRKGDKIALCSRNMSTWGIAFLATLTYGAVAVPILNEFKPDNIHHIVNHSEARLLLSAMSSGKIWTNRLCPTSTVLYGLKIFPCVIPIKNPLRKHANV